MMVSALYLTGSLAAFAVACIISFNFKKIYKKSRAAHGHVRDGAGSFLLIVALLMLSIGLLDEASIPVLSRYMHSIIIVMGCALATNILVGADKVEEETEEKK